MNKLPNKYFYRLGKTPSRSKNKYDSKLEQKNYGIKSIFLMKERFKKEQKTLLNLNISSKDKRETYNKRMHTESSLIPINVESLKSLIEERKSII